MSIFGYRTGYGPYLLGHVLARLGRFITRTPPDDGIAVDDIPGVAALSEAELAPWWHILEDIAADHRVCQEGCRPFGLQLGRLDRTATGKVILRTTDCPHAAETVAQRKVERLLAGCRVPETFRAKSLSTFTVRMPWQRAALAAARAVAAGTTRGLTLAGKTGTGKTHLAVALVNARVQLRRSAVFAKVPDLMADLRAGVRTEMTEAIVEQLRRVDLLVLDDLGAERITEFGLEQLYRVVDHRLTEGKPMVVTTNYTEPSMLSNRLNPKDMGDGLVSYHGRRIVSRLREATTWLVLDGDDVRTQNQGDLI